MVDFVKHSPTYFQIIQPGSSIVTPPYQWRRQVEMSIFGRQRSQMKLSIGYAAFDPASGDVVSHKGNQVKMSIFGRGCSQMKPSTGYAAFDPTCLEMSSAAGETR